MTPGWPIGIIIAAMAGVVSPRCGFSMLVFVTVADMIIAHHFGLNK